LKNTKHTIKAIEKNSNYWLDRTKNELEIETDSALAMALSTTKAAVSQQRQFKNEMSLKTCINVAWALEINPLEVASSVLMQGRKSEEIVFWQKVHDLYSGERSIKEGRQSLKRSPASREN
jgi:maltodextrin utilization protein YvdJ